ncbi:helix-turn-helix transcriptional regulator [Brevibacterium sp. JSBI002]|uniref:helix-turn-helix transcriptional regulator n=1 Tax=Brevibacterium sp. JSBI002 TaxID=2886045 RepID=UPI00222EB01F|nr:LuxR C-terminal-related transcriptional regulator [Brevibacterium sp. JSBI002]UZD62736.1 LuxR C-terminal-related transcriptional regulator [Brevibacterium sp. JSBI002]
MTDDHTNRAVNPHETATPPPSTFDAQWGPRAYSETEFAAAIEHSDVLSESELTQFFTCAGGRTRIADILLRARLNAGVPVADTDPDRIDAQLPPALTPGVDGVSRESAALFLLTLFSWTSRITSAAVDLVHAAYVAADVTDTANATAEDLTSFLIDEGLLTISTGPDEVFAVPALIRMLVRRTTAIDPRLAGKNPREALGAAAADTFGRMRADERSGLVEVVDVAVETRNWHVLERAWARRSVNVFFDASTAVEAYLSVPEDVIATNPILTLARSAARRIDSTRLRLRTDDGPTLLAATDFDSIIVPELHGLLRAEPALPLSADEVAVLTTLEARTHRLNRENRLALDILKAGRDRLRHLGEGHPGPTLMLQSELNLEHGRNLIVAGRFPEAMSMLQRTVQFAEIYTPNSPHPLLSGLVEAALAGMGHGHGSEIDRSLDRARGAASRFGMELPDERTALSIELMRSLDRLDLAAAEQIVSALDTARPTEHLGPLPDVVRSLHYVFQGRASIAAKLLTESTQVGFLPMADAQSTRFSGILNIASSVLAAAGETKALQNLGDRMNPQNPGYSIVKARQALVFGQHDELWSATGQALSGDQGPRLKSSAMALRADILHHEGRADEALETFVHVLDYCSITSSVLAITQLTREARHALVHESAEHPMWEAVARSFGPGGVRAAELRRRLLELPETSPVAPDFQTDLTPAEQSLLFAIDSSKSIAQIAREFGVVSGTLKNRLSALYRKLGVRSRAEAVAHVHRQR